MKDVVLGVDEDRKILIIQSLDRLHGIGLQNVLDKCDQILLKVPSAHFTNDVSEQDKEPHENYRYKLQKK